MSDTVIRVAGLGKQYHLGAARAGYSTFRDQLRSWGSTSLRGLLRRGRQLESKPSFWALKDVSFDVKQGDVVGIIGRNGAGKSTLLKILSRITEPTEGEAAIRGRVGSLLEVGTGFHPELTGRENVFLNGAILGMSRSEIKRRFDEIVAFAEVEKFIDTPVKHYSSGMYMRLAFAVAAHLEPEILIVDEVLAVGDAEFQKKCINKMGQYSKSGRTVLFVSHNLTAMSSLCSRAVVFDRGIVSYTGTIDDAIQYYSMTAQTTLNSSSDGILSNASIVSISGPTEEGISIEMTFDLKVVQSNIGIDITIRNDTTSLLFASSAYFSDVSVDVGRQTVHCVLGPIDLALGNYRVDVRVCEPTQRWIEVHDDLLSFDVHRLFRARHHFELTANRKIGAVIPKQTWTVRPSE